MTTAQYSDGVLRWETPTHRNATKFDGYRLAADQLRERPDTWGVVAALSETQSNTLVQAIKKGVGPFAPPGSFDAASRKGADDPRGRNFGHASEVFAKYIGRPA